MKTTDAQQSSMPHCRRANPCSAGFGMLKCMRMPWEQQRRVSIIGGPIHPSSTWATITPMVGPLTSPLPHTLLSLLLLLGAFLDLHNRLSNTSMSLSCTFSGMQVQSRSCAMTWLLICFGAGSPNAIHYAWEAKVPDFQWLFDKHKHKDFVAEVCPPWNLDTGREGLFAHPPSPLTLTSKVSLSSHLPMS